MLRKELLLLHFRPSITRVDILCSLLTKTVEMRATVSARVNSAVEFRHHMSDIGANELVIGSVKYNFLIREVLHSEMWTQAFNKKLLRIICGSIWQADFTIHEQKYGHTQRVASWNRADLLEQIFLSASSPPCSCHRWPQLHNQQSLDSQKTSTKQIFFSLQKVSVKTQR